MLIKQEGRKTIDLFVAVIISALFSQFSLTILLFTVPLYILYYNKGLKDLLIGVSMVICFIFLFCLVKTRLVDDVELKRAYIIIEMTIPMLLLLGMFFIIDIFPFVSGLRRLYRLFIATLVAMLIILPLSRLLMNNEVFIKTIEEQFSAVAGAFLNNQEAGFEGEVIKSYFLGDDFLEYIKNFYLRTAAAIYFILLLFISRLADIFLARKKRVGLLKLENFIVPEVLLWPALLFAVGMIVDVFELLSLGIFSAIIWNCGIILLFLYGLQGFAIIRTLFERFRLPNSLRFMFQFMVLMLLFIPVANYIVIIGIPVLGISETWIDLRKTIRSTDREDYT